MIADRHLVGIDLLMAVRHCELSSMARGAIECLAQSGLAVTDTQRTSGDAFSLRGDLFQLEINRREIRDRDRIRFAMYIEPGADIREARGALAAIACALTGPEPVAALRWLDHETVIDAQDFIARFFVEGARSPAVAPQQRPARPPRRPRPAAVHSQAVSALTAKASSVPSKVTVNRIRLDGPARTRRPENLLPALADGALGCDASVAGVRLPVSGAPRPRDADTDLVEAFRRHVFPAPESSGNTENAGVASRYVTLLSVVLLVSASVALLMLQRFGLGA
ncbi:hypothetical protein AB1M95_09565 [Sulfitobacter sp. LCG007]